MRLEEQVLTRDTQTVSKTYHKRNGDRRKVACKAVKQTSNPFRPNRIPDAVAFNDVLRLIQNIVVTDTQKVSSIDDEQKLIKLLITINANLSKYPTYFDRNWSGDESVAEVTRHLQRNHEMITGCKMSFQEDGKKAFLNYSVDSVGWGSHVALGLIVDLQEDHTELYELMFYSLAYMINKYNILDVYSSTYFQMELEVMSDSGYDPELYEMKEQQYNDIIDSYAEGSVIHQWFMKLRGSSNVKKLEAILNNFETADKDLIEFISLTREMIKEKSGKTLFDFVVNDSDENFSHLSENGETSFIEGISVYWKDDHLCGRTFECINDHINNCGVIEPMEPLKGNPKNLVERSKQTMLVANIQRWMWKLNDLCYGND